MSIGITFRIWCWPIEKEINRYISRKQIVGTHTFNMTFRDEDRMYGKQICLDFYYGDYYWSIILSSPLNAMLKVKCVQGLPLCIYFSMSRPQASL